MSEVVFDVTKEADGGYDAESTTENLSAQGDTLGRRLRQRQENGGILFPRWSQAANHSSPPRPRRTSLDDLGGVIWAFVDVEDCRTLFFRGGEPDTTVPTGEPRVSRDRPPIAPPSGYRIPFVAPPRRRQNTTARCSPRL